MSVNKRRYPGLNDMNTWQPRDRTKPSLTSIPTDLVNTCLSFLRDEDPTRSSSTCLMFLKAFYRFFRASSKTTEADFREIISASKLGYSFCAITYLNIMIPHNSSDFSCLSASNFHALSRLQLKYFLVNLLPVNPNITWLRLVGCKFSGQKKERRENQFRFYNVQVLSIDGSSNLTEKSPFATFEAT